MVVEGEWLIAVGGCGLQQVMVVKDQIMVVAEWIRAMADGWCS